VLLPKRYRLSIPSTIQYDESILTIHRNSSSSRTIMIVAVGGRRGGGRRRWSERNEDGIGTQFLFDIVTRGKVITRCSTFHHMSRIGRSSVRRITVAIIGSSILWIIGLETCFNIEIDIISYRRIHTASTLLYLLIGVRMKIGMIDDCLIQFRRSDASRIS
jgi:hypothetical protein